MATCKTPAEFDRALKKAVRNAGGDPGEGYRMALRDRFLCRVFSDAEERFVLKGGTGMLARIPHARSTRDLDFATREKESVSKALAAMNELAAKDLGDFCTFSLSKYEETLDENGYSRLLKLRYAAYVGDEEKDPVLIDLSLDCQTTLPPERLEPANRIFIEGVETNHYLLYPLADQLADKLCAIMEKHSGGWPSSRMKDLVDVVAYARNESCTKNDLRRAVECECARRSMKVPREFAAPEEWRSRFASFARKSHLAEVDCDYFSACNIAAALFNPVLASGVSPAEARWNQKVLEWTDKRPDDAAQQTEQKS